jgi:hypothetical protein
MAASAGGPDASDDPMDVRIGGHPPSVGRRNRRTEGADRRDVITDIF